MCLGFIIYDTGRRFKQKKLIKCYIEENNPDGTKSFSELRTVGEFKGISYNSVKRCYEFRMRAGTKYFSIFCNHTMEQLMLNHKIERLYFIFYSLQTYTFDKKLEKSYQKELGWSVQAYIYRAICYIFDLQPSMVLGLLMFAILFAVAFPTVSYAMLIGLGVGFALCCVNYKLKKTEKVKRNLLKKKLEWVTTEKYMSPLESEEEILDIYRVTGTEQIIEMKADGAQEVKVNPLQDKDKDNKELGFKIVKGYDDLYRLQTNAQVKIASIEPVGTELRKRTNQEMLNLKRSYLSRNRAFAEDNFSLKEENERVQREYRELQVQLQYIQETTDKEIKRFGNKVVKEKEAQRNTLMNIYEEIFGSKFVSDNFEQTHEKVLRRIEEEKQRTKADKLNDLIKAISDLVKLVGQKASLDVEQIAKLLNIKNENEAEGKEGAKINGV